MLAAEPTHPARVAFVEAGGEPAAELWWRSRIPPGRGLGFSGAARVAGAFAARRLLGGEPDVARGAAFVVAEQLEGHGDNAAPSAFGGFVVVADGTALPMDVPVGLCVVAWSPASETSTDASRAALPAKVDLADAKFSVARAALWVAAISSGRLDLLAEASRDRLHQPARLASRPDAVAVLTAFRETDGVFGSWLSGSGPTVAGLVGAQAAPGMPAALEARLPPGVLRVLEIDRAGVSEI